MAQFGLVSKSSRSGVSINLDEALDVFDKALAANPTDIEADDIASTMYYIPIRQGMYPTFLCKTS